MSAQAEWLSASVEIDEQIRRVGGLLSRLSAIGVDVGDDALRACDALHDASILLELLAGRLESMLRHPSLSGRVHHVCEGGIDPVFGVQLAMEVDEDE